MQTVSRVFAAGAGVVLALMTAGCGSEPRTAAPPSAAPPITWRQIGSWSGHRGQLTESFEVSTVPMRLHWRTTDETSPGAGRFTVTLHSAASGRPIQTIVEAHGVGSATVEVADEPRWSYFIIEATDVRWQVTLEQSVASDSR